MIKKTFTVKYKEGIHLRPAGLIIQVANQYDCKTKLVFNNIDYEATSIIKLVSACIKCGDDVDVVCSGTDEEKCMSDITHLFDINFE